MKPYLALITAIMTVGTIICPKGATAHSGGTDKYGCHRDNKRGGYHCHNGPWNGKRFSSKSEAEKYFRSQAKNGAVLTKANYR